MSFHAAPRGMPARLRQIAIAQPARFHRTRAVWVNDVHSQLNRTRVQRVVAPRTELQIADTIRAAARENLSICASGSRHAMGGQQFAMHGVLLDLRPMNRVLSFDRESGLIEIEAGIQWPELIQACLQAQPGGGAPWTIAQKQTGADNFTLGGSLSANIHGRGLAMKPFVDDIESLTLIDAAGQCVTCSRSRNPELFRLAIGGYGLFGVITRVTLRLTRRRKLRRIVEMVWAEELMTRLEQHIREGCLYGDFQFCIDEHSRDFLQRGVLSCYRAVEDDTPISAIRQLSGDQWLKLLHLAHTDRAEAFRRYSEHYLSTHGQTYWSDLHQLSPYLPDYAARLREQTRSDAVSSLIISELYVPRRSLSDFLRAAGDLLRTSGVPVIYGTVRLIEADTETFLPWAREPYACIILNLLTPHTPAGIDRSAAAFRDLIDLAASLGGSFYLTYHKFATRQQVERCYPQFPEFLTQKRKLDPAERFQSDWYRHYRDRFGTESYPRIELPRGGCPQTVQPGSPCYLVRDAR